MLLASFVKDPAAVLDYTIDWSPWLAEDAIVTSTWVVEGDVELSDDVVYSSITQVWASGGTEGTLADLTNHVVTEDGREDERTIRLILRQQ
jgi:hypothetical protein